MPRLTGLQEDRIRELETRILAARAQRDRRVGARARCELLSEQATTILATARREYDAARETAREAAAAVDAACRAEHAATSLIGNLYEAITAIEEGRIC